MEPENLKGQPPFEQQKDKAVFVGSCMARIKNLTRENALLRIENAALKEKLHTCNCPAVVEKKDLKRRVPISVSSVKKKKDNNPLTSQILFGNTTRSTSTGIIVPKDAIPPPPSAITPRAPTPVATAVLPQLIPQQPRHDLSAAAKPSYHHIPSFSPHILAIFEKYQASNVRVLSKEDALGLFKEEFGLEGEEAEVMFKTFDKDQNGKLSVWEFQMFCTCMGEHANEIVARFRELDVDNSGQLDGEEARVGLREMKTATGRNLSEKEIDFFIQTAGESGQIDLGHFTNLLYRLKLYDAPPPKQ